MPALMEYSKANLLLKRYGIRSVDNKYVSSAQEAVQFAKGRPIVLKAISGKAMHKSKSGLIQLNLQSEDEIKKAFATLVKKANEFKPYKIQAQHMVKNGLEIIMGGNTDPQFGKLILIGLGGIYVETFKDFALRVCPITARDARSMLKQLRSKSIIAPNPESEKMIEGLLLKVSKLFTENDMTELDLNPLILHDGTYDAVDLRILE
jgi:succinyl-CoA synthetase beta subunit